MNADKLAKYLREYLTAGTQDLYMEEAADTLLMQQAEIASLNKALEKASEIELKLAKENSELRSNSLSMSQTNAAMSKKLLELQDALAECSLYLEYKE